MASASAKAVQLGWGLPRPSRRSSTRSLAGPATSTRPVPATDAHVKSAFLDTLNDDLIEDIISRAVLRGGPLDEIDIRTMKSDRATLRGLSMLCRRLYEVLTTVRQRRIIIDGISAPSEILERLDRMDMLGMVQNIVIDAAAVDGDLEEAREHLAHPENRQAERYRRGAPNPDWIDQEIRIYTPPSFSRTKKQRVHAWMLARIADERIDDLRSDYLDDLATLISACTQLRSLTSTDGWSLPLTSSGVLPPSCQYVNIDVGRSAQMYDIIDTYPQLKGVALHSPYFLPNHVFFQEAELVAEVAENTKLQHISLGAFDHLTKAFLDHCPPLVSLDMALVYGKKGWRDAIVDILEAISRTNLLHIKIREVPMGGRALGWVMRLLPKSIHTLDLTFEQRDKPAHHLEVLKLRSMLVMISKALHEVFAVCDLFKTLTINLPFPPSDRRAEAALAEPMRHLTMEALQYNYEVIYRQADSHRRVPVIRRAPLHSIDRAEDG